ncbi:MAG TPA: hypothetical protein VGN76_07425 [Gemmatimonadales bacterium]|jgi:hypothetical protein|nr:hypothetical protein [Gemmatimonadales bacterium]
MRALLAVLIALPSTGLPILHAQTDYYARLGATYTTKLLRDVIFQEIHVRQSVAPTLVLGGSLPITPIYRAGLEASLTSSGYHSTEGVTETDLGTLRTGSALLNLEGPVGHRASWRAGVGLIRYLPAEDSGIFVRGGTTRFLAGAGLDYRPSLSTRWELMVSLRYDFHRFTTEELTARGFTGQQGVQRISASLGVARARARP